MSQARFLQVVGLLSGCFLCGCSALRQEATPSNALRASEADMKWFRDAKFGLFVHWGPVSLKGTEIGWSRGGTRQGRSGTGEVPAEEYDNLYKRFNPTQFNADEWVRIAQSTGMKYVVFTSKHHDGFNMFDTKLSDYKITNSPFKRDICAELAAACHRHGMKLGWYYSPVDWHHPDYRTENHPRYVEYMHGQLRELCTRYGKIDIIWFDGLGGTATDWDSERLFQMIRGLQPGVLINPRAGLPADYDTPEQKIGTFQVDRAWETCMTICDQWSWKPNDRLKSLDECAGALVRTVGGGGNLLLNVGPMPTGEIEPRQVSRLKEIGALLGVVGKGVYGTRGGPFKPAPWGASTWRGNSVFLHVLQWDSDTLALPAIQTKVIGARVLNGPTLKVEQTPEGIKVHVPSKLHQPIDTVVVLKLDAPADTAHPAPARSGSLAMGKKAVSGTPKNDANNPPGNALDDDYTTCWFAHVDTPAARLEVDLGQPVQVERASISEVLDRVREFEIQYQEGDTWRELTRGTRIGNRVTMRFSPVTAQRFRLIILKTDGRGYGQISEFQLFGPQR